MDMVGRLNEPLGDLLTLYNDVSCDNAFTRSPPLALVLHDWLATIPPTGRSTPTRASVHRAVPVPC